MVTTGSIKVFDLHTGLTRTFVTSASQVREARIDGTAVVWIQGNFGATSAMYYDLSWPATAVPMVLGGPNPPANEIEIGSDYIVWSTHPSYAGNIVAVDRADPALITGATPTLITVSANGNANRPSTSGSWIVWDINGGWSVEGADMAGGGGVQTLVSGSAAHPSIDGDLVSYVSNVSGNFDVYLYRLSDGTTFRVTTDPADQFLNNIFGSNVAYVDSRNGNGNDANFDVFVSSLEFSAPDPCLGLGGDSDADGYCDASDNCALVFNPGQADANNNGIGNACEISGPDLVVLSQAISPTTPTTADLITFSAVVKNVGNLAAGASTLRHRVFAELLSGYLDDIFDFQIPSLAPGDSFAVQRQLNLSEADDSYFVILTADINNTVIESVESNNTLNSGQFSVTEVPPTAPSLSITGGAVVSATQNPDGSWTYVIQGNGPLGGSYGLTIPAGTTALPGTVIEVKIKDEAGTPGRPEFELLNADLAGGTKTIMIPRPNGVADTELCVEDIAPEGELKLDASCSEKPGQGTLSLTGNSGAFNFTLSDGVTRHAAYTVSTVTVSGLLHSHLHLGVNSPPVANPGTDQNIFLGETALLDGSLSSDSDNEAIVSYTWAIESAPSTPTTTSTAVLIGGDTANPSLTPDLVGEYIISLVVNDGQEDSAAATVSINATENMPPVAAIGTPIPPVEGDAPLTVPFDASVSSDPENGALTYFWSFGDGGTGSGATTNHIYSTVGTYTAIVTVTDDYGLTDEASVQVVVTAPNMPPTVGPTASTYNGVAPLDVQFTANGSDPDNLPLGLWRWNTHLC